MNVSQVCRYWRYVSFSTRQLCEGETTRRRAKRALLTSLLRSGAVDFHFKIDSMVNHLELGGTIVGIRDHWSPVKPILDKISIHRKWRKGASLRIPIPAAEPAMKYVITEFPALVHLSFQAFHVYCEPHQPYLELDESFWEVASRLVSLELTGAHQILLDLDSMVMCPHLKYLALNCYFILQDLIHFMDLCPSLESLYLDLSGPSFIKANTSKIGRMTLPSIRSLEIRIEEPVVHAMIRDDFKFFSYQISDVLFYVGVHLKSPRSILFFGIASTPRGTLPYYNG